MQAQHTPTQELQAIRPTQEFQCLEDEHVTLVEIQARAAHQECLLSLCEKARAGDYAAQRAVAEAVNLIPERVADRQVFAVEGRPLSR